MLSEYYGDLYQFLKRSEDKDVYTHNHGMRVQMYSEKICEKLKLSSDIIASLQISSLFHDIGKYFVPDHILKKPDKLTDEEFHIIKKHSADSGLMLKDKFGEKVAEIVSQHHERLDGSGYPRGMKDGEIHLEAKIIAVADTYDAMTSDRAYRKGMSPAYAMEELRRFAGRHYDPGIVEALYEVLLDEGMLTL
jgi:HD-GYP domain-containing protein (c-di-GMP phosphodiesterase class II)